jgi:tetratricopeptide (TPR) repeat protein
MTGRFNRLEFEAQHEPQLEERREVGTPLRTAEHELQDAVLEWRRGRFEPALKHYTRSVGLNRALIPAWVGQVQMLVELGEYTEARLWCDKSLELFKNNGDLLAAKSRACLRMGDRAAASACSDASLQSAGSSPLRWQARGEMMLAQHFDRARDCFDKSLAEPGSDWFDRIAIARIYLFHKVPTPALEFASAGRSLKPDHAYGWLVVGQCEEELGWSDRALASYGRSLELSPRDNTAKAALDRILAESAYSRLWRRIRRAFR